jgi:hypothetical protein
MIVLQKQNMENLTIFHTYDDLLKFLMKVENAKRLEGNIEFGQPQWSFLTYSPGLALTLIGKIENIAEEEILKEAVAQELEIFDIYSGDFEKPVLMLVKPSTDVNGVKQRWCHQFCQAHGYNLTDMVAVESKPKGSMTEIFPDSVPCPCRKKTLPHEHSYIFYIKTSPHLSDRDVNKAIRFWLNSQGRSDLEQDEERESPSVSMACF